MVGSVAVVLFAGCAAIGVQPCAGCVAVGWRSLLCVRGCCQLLAVVVGCAAVGGLCPWGRPVSSRLRSGCRSAARRLTCCVRDASKCGSIVVRVDTMHVSRVVSRLVGTCFTLPSVFRVGCCKASVAGVRFTRPRFTRVLTGEITNSGHERCQTPPLMAV